MIPIILSFLVGASLSGAELLDKTADRYSSSSGFQWSLESEVRSDIFDETELTAVEFVFNAPDTFYFKSENEEVLGIADTVWVLSKRHKQIQKKISSAYIMPSDLIIGWGDRYILEDYRLNGEMNEFVLSGKEGVSPSDVKIATKRNNRLHSINYLDNMGNDVTLTIKKEKMTPADKINLFYNKVPKGYKLIDLTE